MHEADLQGSQRACSVAPTSHVDKVEPKEGGAKATEEDGLVIPLGEHW